MELVLNLTGFCSMEHARLLDADRVLVVEDDCLLREMIVDMLMDEGFATSEAYCADQALQLLRNRNDIAAMVTDVDMPGEMNGIALAAQVSQNWPWIGIVVTSGAHRGGALGVHRPVFFLPKPFRADRLVAAVHSVMATRFAPVHRRAS